MKALVYAIGTEPDVGQLIVEMFRQQDHPDAISPGDMIVLLNETIRTTPDYVDNESGKFPAGIQRCLNFHLTLHGRYGR